MTAVTHDPATLLRERLGCGRPGCSCGRGANTHCPAHDDDVPSLTVHRGEGGALLVHCKAGCPQAVVIDALRARGLWPEQGSRASSDGVRRWAYVDPDGAVIAVHCRRNNPDGSKRAMWWEGPDGQPSRGTIIPASLPLYRWPDLERAPAGEPVLLVEGEKCADVAAAHGLLAVSLAGGASQTAFGAALDVLRGREVVLVPDNDSQGRALMERVAAHLTPLAARVRWLELPGLPPKGDIADWLAGGHSVTQLRDLLTEAGAAPAAAAATDGPAPRILSAPALLALAMPPVRWVVPEILPEGLGILAGRPKMGKSWLVLSLAIAVASGGRALGRVAVEPGSALVLALEDGRRRLRTRVGTLVGGSAAPTTLDTASEWRRIDQGGLDDLAVWLRGHADARLVVIDTLAKLRPRRASRDQGYSEDYADVDALTQLAQEHRVAIVLVAHTRKASADDWIDEVSGTLGLSGGADAIYVLQRERGRADAILRGTGRDLETDVDLALRWDDHLPGWYLAGPAEEYRQGLQTAAILRVLREMDAPATPKDVAEITGEPYGAVKLRMWRMARAGDLRAFGGRYMPAHETHETHVTLETPATGETRVTDETQAMLAEDGSVTRVSPVSSVTRVSPVSLLCTVCGVRPPLAQIGVCQRCRADELVRERQARRVEEV